MTTSGRRKNQAREGSGRQKQAMGDEWGGSRWWEAKPSGGKVVGGEDEWWEAKQVGEGSGR